MSPTGVNDAHCHFFSESFFAVLAAQGPRSRARTAADICDELQWELPDAPEGLADRWLRELDARYVNRAALIASVPGDEESVAAAVARHPTRFVGFFMLDPAAPDAAARATRAVTQMGLRGICLFPAMHQVPLDDDRVGQVVDPILPRAGGGRESVSSSCATAPLSRPLVRRRRRPARCPTPAWSFRP